MTDYYGHVDATGTGDATSEVNAATTGDVSWLAHGNHVYIKDGTTRFSLPQLPSSMLTITQGTTPLIIEGYKDVPGDMGLAKISLPEGYLAFTGSRDDIILCSVDIEENSANHANTITSNTSRCNLFNVKIRNTNATPSSGGSTVSLNNGHILGSDIENTANSIAAMTGTAGVMACRVHSENYHTAAALNPEYQNQIIGYNLFSSNAANKRYGIDFQQGNTPSHLSVLSNTFVDFPTAIHALDTPAYNYVYGTTVMGNLIANANLGILNNDSDQFQANFKVFKNAFLNVGPQTEIVDMSGVTNCHVTGVADSKKFLMSFAVEMDTQDGTGYLFSGGWQRVSLYTAGWGRLSFTYRFSSGASAAITTGDDVLNPNFGMQVITVAGDMNTGDIVMYRGRELINHTSGLTNETLDFSGLAKIGLDQNNATPFTGYFASAYFHNDHNIDLSSGELPAAVLDYFCDAHGRPTDLTTAPSGLINQVGPANTWGANQGTGTLTYAGAASDVANDPEKYAYPYTAQIDDNAHVTVGPFTDPANDDYSLNDIAGGGADLKGVLPLGLKFGVIQKETASQAAADLVADTMQIAPTLAAGALSTSSDLIAAAMELALEMVTADLTAQSTLVANEMQLQPTLQGGSFTTVSTLVPEDLALQLGLETGALSSIVNLQASGLRMPPEMSLAALLSAVSLEASKIEIPLSLRADPLSSATNLVAQAIEMVASLQTVDLSVVSDLDVAGIVVACTMTADPISSAAQLEAVDIAVALELAGGDLTAISSLEADHLQLILSMGAGDLTAEATLDAEDLRLALELRAEPLSSRVSMQVAEMGLQISLLQALLSVGILKQVFKGQVSWEAEAAHVTFEELTNSVKIEEDTARVRVEV